METAMGEMNTPAECVPPGLLFSSSPLASMKLDNTNELHPLHRF
jgi:hypothetical protein